jgi:hypothetical protein
MANIYAMTDTWNNSGTTFTAIKMDVTNTASAAASKLLDLQISTSSKFSVDRDGNIAIGGTDCLLYRDAANVLALRNSTSPQSFWIYNTRTDASNYETAIFQWNANQFEILTYKGGTGTNRSMQIQSAANFYLQSGTGNLFRLQNAAGDYWQIGSGADWHFLPGADVAYDFGTTAFRIRRVHTQQLVLVDGITAPSTIGSHAVIYVDTADGDLKVKFADGVTKVLAADT